MSDTIYVPRKRKKSGGSKKHGRNLKKCARYRAEGRREKNKARRIAKEKRRQEKLRLRRLKKEMKNMNNLKLLCKKCAAKGGAGGMLTFSNVAMEDSTVCPVCGDNIEEEDEGKILTGE